MSEIQALTAAYAQNVLCGWAEGLAKEESAKYKALLPKFIITNKASDYKGKRTMLWEYTRKALGKDTENFAQEIGDCVSFSGKNVLEYTECCQIVLENKIHEFHPVFPPYFYGTSRVFIGDKKLKWSDGSCGAWLQDAIKQYGVLRRDDSSVPPYSGSLARKWGSSGPPDNFVAEGKKYLVETTALITNAEDAANALLNGYCISVCSNQGFNMQASSSGFHEAHGSWGHAMTIIGFEDHPKYGLYFIILNSWGDVHGRLKDFSTDADLPIGVLRARGEVVDTMLSMEDSYVYSAFNGFPDKSMDLEKSLFDTVGA